VSNSHAIEHGSSRAGRWLEARRVRTSLWIAIVESLVVLFSHGITKWTVIALAVLSVFAWVAGRDNRSQVIRELLWILAASQLLALIAVLLGVVVKWFLVLAVVVFAVGALFYLFRERRR
jgi:hypothetical protein